MSSVCVVGGGVAGLSAAYYAVRQGASRVVVLESSSRLGGWVNTSIQPDTGVIMETGPRTIRPGGLVGANTLNLVEELGLSNAVRPIKYGHPSTVNRLILVDGKLHKLPSSIASVFKTLPPFSRPLATSIVKDLFTSRKYTKDEPLYDFISRRFGDEVARFTIDPVVRGICAGNSKEISVHFLASYLHQMEQEKGRVFLGLMTDYIKGLVAKNEPNQEDCELVRRAKEEKWAVWGLQGGLETLVHSLSQYLELRGVEIKKEVLVNNVSIDKSQVQVSWSDGGLRCDHLVMATPSYSAANLLSPLSKELASYLSSIPFVSVAVVNMEFKGRILPHQGFGFLVPSDQPQPILGCIYDTCTFPQGRDRTLLTVMIGGAWYDQVVKDSQQVERMAVDTVSQVLGLSTPPVRCSTSLLSNCIAQYTVGHRERVESARQILRDMGGNISLVGSSYDGVGINDTIMSSKKAVIQ